MGASELKHNLGNVRDLLTSLNDPDLGIRTSVAEALGKLRDPLAIDPMIRALADDSALFRETVGEALVHLGTPAVEPLARTLSQPLQQNVRRETILILGEMRDKRSVQHLAPCIHDTDWTIRLATAIALGKIPDETAAAPLIVALRDSEPRVREAAAEALGNHKDSCATDPLIAVLSDPDSSVGGAAVQALDRIASRQATGTRLQLLAANSVREFRTAEAEKRLKEEESARQRDEERLKCEVAEYPERAAARALADTLGVNLADAQPVLFADKGAAEGYVKQVRQAIPEVQGAYKASGKLPLRSVIFLLLGIVLGIVAAGVAGYLFSMVPFSSRLFNFFLHKDTPLGLLPRFLLSSAGFMAGVIFFLMYPISSVLVGLLAGVPVVALAHPGKNRNVPSAVLSCVLAALFAQVALRAILQQLPVEAPGPYRGWIVGIPSLVITLVGAALAGLGAGAWEFCENCQSYMETIAAKGLSVGQATVFLRALNTNDTLAACGVLDLGVGHDVTPELIRCPKCKKGFLQLTIHLSPSWSYKTPDKVGTAKMSQKRWRIHAGPLGALDRRLLDRMEARLGAPAGNIPRSAGG